MDERDRFGFTKCWEKGESQMPGVVGSFKAYYYCGTWYENVMSATGLATMVIFIIALIVVIAQAAGDGASEIAIHVLWMSGVASILLHGVSTLLRYYTKMGAPN